MAIPAIHPGEHLAEELKELNMSAAALARQLKVPTNRITEIVNGHYRTRDGKGTVGGPHVVTIFGTNGKTATETYDNSLFSPYRSRVELPKQDASLDFSIPNDHS